MSALAVMLIAMGIADAVRRLTRSVWVPLVTAPVVVVACAALSGLWHVGDLPLLAVAAAAGVGWVVLCARAEKTGENQGAPLAVFGIALALLILLSGWASDVGGLVERWTSWVEVPGVGDVSPGRLLMVVGVVLLQFVTGNQLVAGAASVER
jgi:hypothetical protein